MDDQHGTVRQVRVLLMSLVFMFAACGDLPQISELPLEATEMDEIKGIWEGALDVRGTKLRLVFHIDAEEKVLTARMDSPDQGLRDIPIADVRYDGSRLMLESEQFGLTYDGTVVEPDRIDGVFYQRGYEVKLALSRVDAPTERSRPQDPGEPLPYQVEEVSFESQVEGSTLAGSLTLPPETRAVAVLVSGSGQQDRDSTIMGHRPFLVLADHLSRAGVAVLRYDDRGLGGSTGPLDSATSRNFANDASAALDFLKGRPGLADKPLGVIGHSEGGLIATMLGAERNDLAFIVLLASPGVNGIESLDAQNRALYEESGGLSDDLLEARLEILRSSNSLVAGEGDLDTVLQQAREYLAEALEPYTARQRARMGFPSDNEMLLQAMASPWLRYLLAYEPARDLRRISIPVLALYGTRDLQVLAEQNAPAVRAALEAARNTRFEVLVLENLNHLFQTAETGLPSEYGRIDETMSPLVLEKIENWILGLSTID